MRSEKDVEAYLLRLSHPFRTVEDNPATFLVDLVANMPPVAIRVDPPLVVVRVHIGDTGGHDKVALFRKMLELNAKALVHAAYGLEDNQIVLAAALELENLDFNELAAALEEMDVALAQQVPVLAGLNGK